MSKIDHADDAIDHGVADGDQAIDRAEDNAVDELLGEIVHALPLTEPFPAKWRPVLPRESARAVENDAARAPGSRNDASSHFLTVGTRCGNSGCCGLIGLYRGSFGCRFQRHSRNTPLPFNERSGTGLTPETNCGLPGCYLPLRPTRTLRSTREIPMPNQNEKPG